jgi:murein L,D-transpeptidase YafK
MPFRRAFFAFSILASMAIVAGLVVYPHLWSTTKSAAPSPVTALLGPTGASLIGLRGRAPWTALPAPNEAAGLQEPTDAAPATTGSDPAQLTAESLEIEAPAPPRRPLDLTSALEFPFPPRRPVDIFANFEPAPSPLETNGAAAETLVSAPLPPSRPRDLVAEAPQPSPATIADAPEVLVAAPLPPPRPRDLVAAVTPPATPAQQTQASAAQEIAAHTAEPSLRDTPEANANADKSGQPPRFAAGAPAYVRIFKKESELELWLKVNGRYALYRTFPICKWSGRLGPKVHEADYQSPEGFYSVSAKQLNPRSNYHLAFNVGYPNAFDRQNGRTGGLVMVHGNCKSVGCFAMTDKGVDEIYRFVAAALAQGQREVPVHIFPFRMTDQAIAQETGGGNFLSFLATENSSKQWAGFWSNLKEGYDIFEHTGEPPTAYACGDHYAFGAKSSVCTKIAGW